MDTECLAATKGPFMHSPDLNRWVCHVEQALQVPPSVERHWRIGPIYKVPAFIKVFNRKAFTPELVSFGPYHHGNCELKPMEVHKSRALVQFIRRAGKPLNELMSKVYEDIIALQDSYYDLDERWHTNDHEFLKLMITDGCFMFELLHFCANMDSAGYSPYDPLFSLHGHHHIMPHIRRDMLLIENQLPLFLLEILAKLQNLQFDEEPSSYTHKLASNFLTGRVNYGGILIGRRHHTLSLFRQSQLRSPTEQMKARFSGNILRHSAAELNEAGVKFQRCPMPHLNDIKFDSETGVLYLPCLVVDDATEVTFLNMTAYEYLDVGVDKEVTSYVCFMNEIIESEKDVSLLRREGIIVSSLGSNKAVVHLFNGISRGLTDDPESGLMEVRMSLGRYCQKIRTRCRAKLRGWRLNLVQTYFTNPWSALSLAGALLLLGLTIIQAVYAILQYYEGKSQSGESG